MILLDTNVVLAFLNGEGSVLSPPPLWLMKPLLLQQTKDISKTLKG